MKRHKAGNHLNDNSIDIGGLYCISSAKRAMQLIESAEFDGAKILLGDKKITHHTGIGAHILTNVHPEMKIWHEETFAPILALTTFSTDDEAVAMANDTDTSLCASVFSRDILKALEMGRKLRTGSTHINGPTI